MTYSRYSRAQLPLGRVHLANWFITQYLGSRKAPPAQLEVETGEGERAGKTSRSDEMQWRKAIIRAARS